MEDELHFICSLSINDSKKAEAICKLLSDNTISHTDVTNFLFKHNLRGVAQEFFSLDSLESQRLPKQIVAASGSDWTKGYLEYFSVVIEDVDVDTICEISDIGPDAKRFLEYNKNLDARSFAGKKGNELTRAATTDFQRKVLFVLMSPSKESCVDGMMQTFLESILGDRFLVEQRYKMLLTVSNVKKESTADLVAILFPDLYIGVIVVEDKSEELSKAEHQHQDAEAQMISEGIAVAQQDNWLLSTPVYMLRVMKTSVSIYQAVFSEEFLRSVKTGIRRMFPLVIKRYAPSDSIVVGRSRPGLDIVDPTDRELLVKIVHSISVSIMRSIDKNSKQ